MITGNVFNFRFTFKHFICILWIQGLAIAVLGPTLQDLQVQLQTDLPHISYIFTGRSAGYVAGSILGGIVFERYHPLMLIAITLGMSGIGLIVTPYAQQLIISVITISFVGAAMGALDTGKFKMKFHEEKHWNKSAWYHFSRTFNVRHHRISLE